MTNTDKTNLVKLMYLVISWHQIFSFIRRVSNRKYHFISFVIQPSIVQDNTGQVKFSKISCSYKTQYRNLPWGTYLYH
jgi:hypothetical protein